MTHITYIANIRLPSDRAHGIQIMKMCEAFAQAGNTVTLVIPRRLSTIAESAFSYYGITHHERFHIVRLPVIDLTWFGTIYTFHLERLSFIISCWFYICIIRPKVVYTRGEDVLYLARMRPRTASLFWETHIKPDHMERYQKIFSRIRGLITVTRSYADELSRAYGVDAARVFSVHDGIDASFLEPSIPQADARKKFGITTPRKVALYVGLLDEWKGHLTLLRSAERLRASNVQVVLVGGSTEQNERYSKEFPNAILLPYVPYKHLPELQAAADVLIIPNSAKSNVSMHYTSPLKLFAHMASGIPIVASNISSLLEVLNNHNGYLFTPDDEVSLCQTIMHVMQHPKEAKQKADIAKDEVRQYLWSERANKILSFMQKCI